MRRVMRGFVTASVLVSVLLGAQGAESQGPAKGSKELFRDLERLVRALERRISQLEAEVSSLRRENEKLKRQLQKTRDGDTARPPKDVKPPAPKEERRQVKVVAVEAQLPRSRGS